MADVDTCACATQLDVMAAHKLTSADDLLQWCVAGVMVACLFALIISRPPRVSQAVGAQRRAGGAVGKRLGGPPASAQECSGGRVVRQGAPSTLGSSA